MDKLSNSVNSNDTSETYQKINKLDVELKSVDAKLKELKEHRRKLLEKRTQLIRVAEHRSATVGADSDAWENGSFDWSEELNHNLKTIFSMQEFRPCQKSAINAALSGEDVILIMSTGGGKSLCYQLPATLTQKQRNGIVLVVSPLISLMEDQVIAMKNFGIGAAMLSFDSSKEAVADVQNMMTNPKIDPSIKLIFVSPEKLAKSKRFMSKLEKMYQIGRFALLAIDEVHCCSQWGHDFRPDYAFLNVMKRQFPNVPILGLTATATARVIDDVKPMLSIPGCLVFRSGFNRPNLFYEVRPKPAADRAVLDDIATLIKRDFGDQSGIIYCFTRKETEELAAKLVQRKIKADYYHAYRSSAERSEVHQRWLAKECHVIVATVAFGMGIDKPDVRFVVHYTIPKSPETYYQESGRAGIGRDGETARCILFYRFSDVFRQSSMICTDQMGPDNLMAMVAYCHNAENRCRRAVIAEHFGESWSPDWCKAACDVCKSCNMDESGSPGAQSRDLAKDLRQLVQILQAADSRLTGLKLLDAWRKSTGKGLSQSDRERIIIHLILDGYLRQDYHFTAYSICVYIVPSARGLAFVEAEARDQKLTVNWPASCPKSMIGSAAASVDQNSSDDEPTRKKKTRLILDDSDSSVEDSVLID